MTDLNDWHPTTPDNLPWGEVVEVRWPDGSIVQAQPCIMVGCVYWRSRVLHIGECTEWRRLERGEAQG